jgi:hypothetical protein
MQQMQYSLETVPGMSNADQWGKSSSLLLAQSRASFGSMHQGWCLAQAMLTNEH